MRIAGRWCVNCNGISTKSMCNVRARQGIILDEYDRKCITTTQRNIKKFRIRRSCCCSIFFTFVFQNRRVDGLWMRMWTRRQTKESSYFCDCKTVALAFLYSKINAYEITLSEFIHWSCAADALRGDSFFTTERYFCCCWLNVWEYWRRCE